MCSVREQTQRPERDVMFRTLQRKGVNLQETSRSPMDWSKPKFSYWKHPLGLIAIEWKRLPIKNGKASDDVGIPKIGQ